uniref:AA_permease domain-containing protein n=1 Tax=Globodera pallida TaxID=36090 RepID=A0A183C7M5_GLOPA
MPTSHSSSASSSNTFSNSNKIGVFEAIAYCVGDIVGSGIFISPTSILQHTGSVGMSLCVWVAGAVVASCAAMVYVELGTSIQKSGCDFAYLSHAKWHPFAAAFLWVSTTLTFPAIMAIQTLTFGEYIFDGLRPFWPSLEQDKAIAGVLKRLIGYMAIWLISFINLFSLQKIAARFQVILTVLKLMVITLIILVGLYQIIIREKTENFHDAFAGTKTDVGEIVLGMFASLFAYNGWDVLNFATEEIENPRRVLPIGALCGIAISGFVYVLINIAYFSVMTVDELKQSQAVAVLFAEKTLGAFSRAVPFLVAILLLGNLNSSIFASYLFAGAKNGIMPTALSTVHSSSMSPRVAVLYEMLSLIVLSFVGDLEHLIGYMSYSLWLQKSFTVVALLYMRQHECDFPRRKDALRTPIVLPLLCLCFFVSMLVISAKKNPFIIIYTVVMLAVGLILYYIFIFPQRTLPVFERINKKSVRLVQLLLNTVELPKED